MFDQTPLRERLGPGGYTASQFRDNFRLHVAAERVYDCLQCLQEACGFDMLSDLTAVDYLNYPGAKDRFGVVYALLNTSSGERVYVKTAVNEPELRLPSVYRLWRGADWLEREVYDMFGIPFANHPDLRRILLTEDFVGHPLRKEFPLEGHDFDKPLNLCAEEETGYTRDI